jgi:hypothetical protein
MAGEYIPGQGGGSAQTPEQLVFWGYDNRPQYSLAEIDAGAPAGGGGRKQTKSATQAAGYLWQLAQTDPKQYEAYRSRMITAGVIGVDGTGADMQQAWMRALDASATAYAAGTMLTPWDAIDLLGQGYGDPNENFTGTKTTTSTSSGTSVDTKRNVDLSSASEARAFLLAAAEQQLGRAATADEIAAFRAALNNEEKANADVTVTKGSGSSTVVKSTNVVDGEAVSDNSNTTSSSSTDTTTSGGMDRGQYAVDYARSADDYAEYQAATTYMNTLFAALSSPTEVGTN